MHNRSLILPYKSPALALIFCVMLGPVGLLYSSFWGGMILSLVGIVVVSAKFFYPILFLWVISCILASRSVDRYNQKILKQQLELQKISVAI